MAQRNKIKSLQGCLFFYKFFLMMHKKLLASNINRQTLLSLFDPVFVLNKNIVQINKNHYYAECNKE